MIDLICLGLAAACLLSGDNNKKDKKAEARKREERRRKERRAREEYERKQREHLYWCETHGEL